MARTLFLLAILPFLLGIVALDEPEPYMAFDPPPTLPWSEAIARAVERLDDPFLRVVTLERHGLLQSRCEEDVRIAMDLRDLTVSLHASLVDLGGRSKEIARTGVQHLAMEGGLSADFEPSSRLPQDRPAWRDLASALAQLAARQELEEEHRMQTARAIGRAYGSWRHSAEWCEYDRATLAWLQYRHREFHGAILAVIASVGDVRHALHLPDKSNFYMRLLRPS